MAERKRAARRRHEVITTEETEVVAVVEPTVTPMPFEEMLQKQPVSELRSLTHGYYKYLLRRRLSGMDLDKAKKSLSEIVYAIEGV